MRKIAIVFLLILVLVGSMAAQETSPFETGPMLFVSCPERCQVFVDGTLRGEAPLLVWDLEPGQRHLELRSGERSVLRELDVKAGIAVLSSIELSLPPPVFDFEFPGSGSSDAPGGEGLLALEGLPEGATLRINGGETAFAPELALPAGLYLVEASRDGSAARVEIVRLEPGVRLALSMTLQKDTATLRAERSRAWFPALLGGAALSGAGVVLSLNSIAVPLSGSSYQTYTGIKYVSIAAVCAGAVTALLGAAFTFF